MERGGEGGEGVKRGEGGRYIHVRIIIVIITINSGCGLECSLLERRIGLFVPESIQHFVQIAKLLNVGGINSKPRLLQVQQCQCVYNSAWSKMCSANYNVYGLIVSMSKLQPVIYSPVYCLMNSHQLKQLTT